MSVIVAIWARLSASIASVRSMTPISEVYRERMRPEGVASYLMRGHIRGLQRQSEAISDEGTHQRSSGAISDEGTHQRSSEVIRGARIGNLQLSSLAISSVPPERRKREPTHRIRMQRARRSHTPERPDRGGAEQKCHVACGAAHLMREAISMHSVMEQKCHVARGAAHLMREAISMYSVMEATCDVARWSSSRR